MDAQQTITRYMVKGLAHEYAGIRDDRFFAAIDATGGWPLGYKFVGFEHTDERAAGFCNSPYNDGWWTILASADDYYLWKLSPEALQRVVDAAITAIRLPRPVASKLWVKNSRGHQAMLSQETGAAS